MIKPLECIAHALRKCIAYRNVEIKQFKQALQKIDLADRELESDVPGQEIGPIIQAQENDTEKAPPGQSMPGIRECAPT